APAAGTRLLLRLFQRLPQGAQLLLGAPLCGEGFADAAVPEVVGRLLHGLLRLLHGLHGAVVEDRRLLADALGLLPQRLHALAELALVLGEALEGLSLPRRQPAPIGEHALEHRLDLLELWERQGRLAEPALQILCRADAEALGVSP